MTNTAKQQAFEAFDLLSDREQSLVCELINSLAPDDTATPDDIAVHAAAMDDYRRGETISHDAIKWD